MNNTYRILMIEDLEEFHSLISRMLEQHVGLSFKVDWFENLTSGIEKLKQNVSQYDVILLDLDLPDSRGINTLQTMVAKNFDLPIIVISGSYEENVLLQTIKIGAQDFLPKGQFNKTLLIKSILYAIEKYKLQKEIEFRHDQLEIREKKFRTLAESSSDGIVVTDRNGIVLFVNSSATKLLSKSQSELIGHPIEFPFGDNEHYESDIQRNDLESIIAEIKTVRTFWNSSDDYLLSIRDITSRKKAELALEESLDFMNKLVESIPNPVFFKDVNGVFIGCNSQYLKFTGKKREEVIGKTLADFMPPGKRAHFEHKDIELLHNPGTQIYEMTHIDPTGKEIHTLITKATFSHKNENTRGIIGQIIDITESKAVELKLKQSEKKFSSIFHSNPDPIAICRYACGEIIEVNEAFEYMSGFSRDELLGKGLDKTGFWMDKEEKDQIFSDLEKTEKIRARLLRIQNKDEKILHVLCSFDTLTIESEKLFMVICKDITEQKKLEDQLYHAQKMESIGRLAAGIAHEINTPIQYVHDNVDFLSDSFHDFIELINLLNGCIDNTHEDQRTPIMNDIVDLEQDRDFEFLLEEIPSSITQSIEGIERVTKIVKAMKSFAHPGIEEKAPLNLNEAIESTITVAKNEWKYVADITTDYNEDLPFVHCYAGDFKQIILNLIVNAAHAIGEKQKKEKSTDAKGLISIRTDFNDRCAIIEVADSGTGIPDNVKRNIFEPFFTTKPVGIGTGQGLAIVYNIVVKKHSGRIEFDTAEGEGTRFHIEIPISVSE